MKPGLLFSSRLIVAENWQSGVAHRPGFHFGVSPIILVFIVSQQPILDTKIIGLTPFGLTPFQKTDPDGTPESTSPL
jgi:hypothetical protein